MKNHGIIITEEVMEKMKVAFKAIEAKEKERLGISIDQKYIKSFIRYPRETREHKLMKEIVKNHFLNNGILEKDILIEKHYLKYNTRPDVLVNSDKRKIIIECHYHDSWENRIYELLERGKKLQEYMIICIPNDKKRDNRKYVKRQKILKNADEVWIIDIEKQEIIKKIR